MSGWSVAIDVLESFLIHGALPDWATGSTVGGDGVPWWVAEYVEDDTEGVRCDTVFHVLIGKDASTGTVVLGMMFHATGGSCMVWKYGSSIGLTIRNFVLFAVVEVEHVSEVAAGFEPAIGLICTKVGMV